MERATKDCFKGFSACTSVARHHMKTFDTSSCLYHPLAFHSIRDNNRTSNPVFWGSRWRKKRDGVMEQEMKKRGGKTEGVLNMRRLRW